MTDMIGSTSRTCAARIDSRILTHLLLEATDLLEESQVHAAIETPCRATSAALSQSMWRLATTCAWVLQQLNAGWGDGNEAARMQGAAPLSVPSDDEQSEPLRLFLRRVSRLHERACKLHELTSEPQRETVEPRPAPVAETREPAEVISIFRDRPEPAAEVDAASNPVLSAQSRLGWLFSPC